MVSTRAIPGPYAWLTMAIAHEVDALVRERPGITREQLRKAIGTDVDDACKRLVQVGYIRRERSKGYSAYYPIGRPRD